MSEVFARRYRLLERIAIGGTAEVFRAQLVSDDGARRDVVIKRVLPQFARDQRFRRLFLEEACVTATLAHRNIVRVLDHGEIDDTCYIALEPVDGKDLGSLLAAAGAADAGIDAPLAALLTLQVAEALQFIHEHTSSEGFPLRIIHRDVSPQNILVSTRGDVKLTDFGIAKSAIRREHTVDGTLRGKLDYMAPEQTTGADVDHRADIFGLGCVLYELIAGTPPFRGSTEIETLDRLREGRLDRPPDTLDAPAALRAVLARALELDPVVRYQHAEEMAADLRAFLATLDAPPDPEQLGRWAREAAARPARRTDAVDDAVRLLLGEPGEESEPEHVFAPPGPAPAAATSVFVQPRAPAHRSAGATARVDLPRRPPSRRAWIVAPLVAVGVLGWVLWMFDRASVPAAPADAAAPPDSGALALAPDLATAAGALPDSAPAWLWIRSTPSGARVLLGAELAGTTPLRLSPPAAGTVVELRKPGYQPLRLRWEPDAGKSEIDAVLARSRAHTPATAAARGYLTVNSLPWSRVFLDGQFVGNTPLVRMEVRAGSLKVQLRAPDGSLRHAFQAVVREGATRSYAFDLTKRRR